MSSTDFQKFLLSKANESIADNLPNVYRINDQTDRIIVWLVGFSVTAITLIIANFNSANDFVKHVSDVVIIFSAITVLLGILYRIFLLIFQRLDLGLIVSFDQFVAGYNLSGDAWYTRDVSAEDTSYEDILLVLKEDFGLVINKRDDFSRISLDEQKRILEELAGYYNELQERRYEFEAQLFEKTLSDNLGKGALSNKSKNGSKHIWKYNSIANYLFYSTCVTFLLGLIIVVFMYFFYKTDVKNENEDSSLEKIETVMEKLNDIPDVEVVTKDSTSLEISLDTINVNTHKTEVDTLNQVKDTLKDKLIKVDSLSRKPLKQ